MKKIIVDVEDELKRRLNIMLAKKGITQKDFVLKLVEEAVVKSEIDDETPTKTRVFWKGDGDK